MKTYEIRFDSEGNPISPKVGLIGIPDSVIGIIIVVAMIIVFSMRIWQARI